jgi:hypothetical protein
MAKRKEYVMAKFLGISIAVVVAAIFFSQVLPPPQCDLLGHCTTGVAALR